MTPTLSIVVAAWLAAPPVPADAAAPAIIATCEVSGTDLIVSPRIGFSSATLRVAGPAGYEAIAWSEGEPLALDLLTNGFLSGSDGGPGGPPAVLPDGHYGYEVVFHLAEGELRVLSPADSAGLALAAIQGLDALLDRDLQELRARSASLAAENDTLRERLLELEERLGAVVAALDRGSRSDTVRSRDSAGADQPAAAREDQTTQRPSRLTLDSAVAVVRYEVEPSSH